MAFCDPQDFDIGALFNSSDPSLSPCVQESVFVWVPCAFLWLCTPVIIYSGLQSNARIALNWPFFARLAGCTALIILCALLPFYDLAVGEVETVVHVLYPTVLLVSFFHVTATNVWYWHCGVQTSGVTFIFWLLLLIGGIPEFKWHIQHHASAENSFLLAHFVCYYGLVILELVLSCFADETEAEEEDLKAPKSHRPPSKELQASFLNQLTFWWLNDVFLQAAKRPLVAKDLPVAQPDPIHTIKRRWDEFWIPMVKEYEAKKASGKKGKINEPSIIYALFRLGRGRFLMAVTLKFIYDALQFVAPQILKQLIAYVETKATQPLWVGLFWAVLMFASAQVQSFVSGQYFHRMFTLGMWWRSALTTAVFEKSLRLSSASRRETTVGEVVNLMAVDSNRFQQIGNFVCLLWSAPFQIILSLAFLYVELNNAVFAGFAILILILPLNFLLMSKIRGWTVRKSIMSPTLLRCILMFQVRQMRLKDERIKLMTEVLGGIKVLKLYGWELGYQEMLTKIRKEELNNIKKTNYLNAVILFFWSTAPFLVAAATFATYVLIDPVNNVLTPSKAFVSLSLLNILQFPMVMLPNLAAALVQVPNIHSSPYCITREEYKI